MKDFSPIRLGTAGSYDVKEHHYFYGLDWNSLLRMKADFIPQLEDEEDISYFDSRLDRYNHEIEQTEDDSTNRSSAEDTDADTTGAGASSASFGSQSMFASFTSASPRYRKATGSGGGGSARDPSLIAHRHSMSVCESTTLPDSPAGGGGVNVSRGVTTLCTHRIHSLRGTAARIIVRGEYVVILG